MFEIRAFAENDVSGVFEILCQISLASFLPPDEANFRNILQNSEVRVAERKAELIGLWAVRFYGHHQRFAEITAIGVREEWRRQGYGTLIFRDMLTSVHDKNARLLHLNVASGNHAAVSFYSHMGFQTKAYYMEMDIT